MAEGGSNREGDEPAGGNIGSNKGNVTASEEISTTV